MMNLPKGKQMLRLIAPPLLAAAFALPAAAQDGPLVLELNATEPAPGGCRMTFVATNQTADALLGLGYQMGVFDGAGVVRRLPVLDFGALPVGKTRIVQFDLPGQDCTDISRIVVNTATRCDVGAGDSTLCTDRLETRALTPIGFGQ